MVVDLSVQSLPVVLFTLGVLLAIAEAVAPGAHLIVVGVALIVAGLVGIGLSVLPVSWPILTVVMTLTVLATGAAALKLYRELNLYQGSGVGRTRDSASLRGSTGRVTERVTPTGGEIKLDQGGFNPFYRARSVSGEISEGEEVVVVDPGGGNVLTVESLGGGEDEIDRQLRLGREQERELEQAEG